ncbi:MAG: response regulator [Planctomycetota bacterium]
MGKPKILIIEDDPALCDVISYNLIQADCDVLVARDGQDGLHQTQTHCPDLLILDLMLPVLHGLEVCRQIRSNPQTQDTLILMLTAKSEEGDQIEGFNMGADDYVTKPFSVKVLLERIKALLRRRENPSEDQPVVGCQGVKVDRVRHRVTVFDVPIDLTPSEFRLLDAMIRNPGRAFSRNELIDAALGEETIVLERTIDVHVRSLRKKLGEYADLVETVRGVGYRFREPQGVAV